MYGGKAMRDCDNAAYYLARAEQEDEAARLAVKPVAVIIHESLASRYRAKASECQEYQTLSVVPD